MAQYLLAQAFRMKDQYPQSIESARAAIQLNPSNPEPHFWLAESLRLSGAYEKGAAEYAEYLRLSDFDSKLAGKLNYYVLGFLAGFGKKKRAAQQDIWKDLRSLAYFGICDCQRKLSNYDAAIVNCQRALTYDADDPVCPLCARAGVRAEGAGHREHREPARGPPALPGHAEAQQRDVGSRVRPQEHRHHRRGAEGEAVGGSWSSPGNPVEEWISQWRKDARQLRDLVIVEPESWTRSRRFAARGEDF